jgi:hypothetical protein
MKSNFIPRELLYFRVEDGFSSLSDKEIDVIRTLEPTSISSKRDTIMFHVDQLHDIEELSELYKYMNERQCTLIEFYLPKNY